MESEARVFSCHLWTFSVLCEQDIVQDYVYVQVFGGLFVL